MQYVNCLNKLRFLAKVSTNYKKCIFSYNLRTITPEQNMKTREISSFFSSTFSTLREELKKMGASPWAICDN